MRATASEVRCTDLLSPAMLAYLDCAEQALITCERPACKVFLAPGAEVAWDTCSDCSDACQGQLWIRLIEVYPSTNWPTADAGNQPCGIHTLGLRLGLGVLRCAHTINDQGNPPTQEELTEDALVTTADASTLLSAIQCCTNPDPNAPTTRVGRWTPLGPRGGCVGGEWELVIGVGNCGCR